MKRIIPNLPAGERVFWARAHFTPKEDLALLANDKDERVLKALAANPTCPPEVLLRLVRRDLPLVVVEVAGNPSAPPELLEELYKFGKEKRGNPWFRPFLPFLAGNPSTPVHILEELAGDWEYREAVARNPSTPPGLLRELIEGSPPSSFLGPYVARCVAQNPSAPIDVLTRLAEAYADAVAGNPSLPEEYLRRLGRSQKGRVRARVGRNPSTPKDVLEALAVDKDPEVRGAVAQNSAVPLELLGLLAGDASAYVREMVALNPKCPLEWLVKLDELRLLEEYTALKNPSLSPEGLVQLILARFERVGRLYRDEALKLLPFLELIPKDPSLWLAIWEELDGEERRILEGHPDAKGVLLLGRLGR